jgi:hypothetical protein
LTLHKRTMTILLNVRCNKVKESIKHAFFQDGGRGVEE